MDQRSPERPSDQGDDFRNEEIRRRRRNVLYFLGIFFFFYILFSATDEAVSASSGGNDKNSNTNNNNNENGNNNPYLPVLQHIAETIESTSEGLVYPSNISDHFIGNWIVAGSAKENPDGFLLPSFAGSNYTVQYGLRNPSANTPLAFRNPTGDIAFRLYGSVAVPSIPSLQDVVGVVEIFDGTSSKSGQRLEVFTQGVYAADAGVLFLVGSSNGGGVNILPKGGTVPSPSPSKVPSASLSPSPASTSGQRVLLDDDNLVSSPHILRSASPSNTYTRTNPGRILQEPTPVPTVVPSPSVVPRQGADRCDLLIALRFRPLAYNPNTQAIAKTLCRRLVEKEYGTSRSLYGRDTDFLHRTQALLNRGNQPYRPSSARKLGSNDELLGNDYAKLTDGSSIEKTVTFDSSLLSLLIPSPFASLMDTIQYRNLKKHSGTTNPTNGDNAYVDDFEASLADSVFGDNLEALSSILDIPPYSSSSSSSPQGTARLLLEANQSTDSTASFLSAFPHYRSLASAPAESLYPGARFVPLYGHIVSPNCNFSMNITATTLAYDETYLDDKVTIYAMLSTFIGILLLMVTAHQIVTSASQTAAFRISLLTMGIQALMDCWLCFIYFVVGFLFSSAFSTFAASGFVHLVLFSMLEMRFMLLIWKSRHPDAFALGWVGVRRELTRLYCRFYGGVLMTFVFLYIGTQGSLRFLLFLLYSYWWPQIFHSAQHDQRHGLNPRYVIVSSISRLVPVLYLFACPYNILYYLTPNENKAEILSWGNYESMHNGIDFFHPNPVHTSYMLDQNTAPAYASAAFTTAFGSQVKFAIFLVVWQVIQIVFLYLQSKVTWGPRFFVPYVFLPAKYNYHRFIEVRDGRVLPNPRVTEPWLLHVRPHAQDDEDSDDDTGENNMNTLANPPVNSNGNANTTNPVENNNTNNITTANTNTNLPNANTNNNPPSAPVRTPTDQIVSSANRYVRRYRRYTVRQVRYWYRISVFFMHGMQQLFEDTFAYGQRAYTQLRDHQNTTHSRTTGGTSTNGAAAIHRSNSGQGNGGFHRWFGGFRRNGNTNTQYSRMEENGNTNASSPNGSSGDNDTTNSTNGMSEDIDNAELGQINNQDTVVGTVHWSPIDCVVCMESVNFPIRSSQYMVTPCDHLFHTQCLRPWMDQSLQCPICRLQLPAP